MTILALLTDDNLIGPDVHNKLFQRFRRRTFDIFAVQIEMAVMTGAPDLADIRAILHDTPQMSAGGGEGLNDAGRRI